MKWNRRSFIKRASGLVVAAVAAPLYIPAERLAFGVPRPLAIARPIIELPAFTYSLYAGGRKVGEVRNAGALPDVRFDASETMTVDSVSVEFADGRPAYTERIHGVTLMDGDSLMLRFDETWQ